MGQVVYLLHAADAVESAVVEGDNICKRAACDEHSEDYQHDNQRKLAALHRAYCGYLRLGLSEFRGYLGHYVSRRAVLPGYSGRISGASPREWRRSYAGEVGEIRGACGGISGASPREGRRSYAGHLAGIRVTPGFPEGHRGGSLRAADGGHFISGASCHGHSAGGSRDLLGGILTGQVV